MRGYPPGVQEDVGHGCMETCEKLKTIQMTVDWLGVDGYLR